jgi:hypothetical protein
VEAIDGGETYKPLRMEKWRRGAGNPHSKIETVIRYLRIWHFVEWQRPKLNNDAEAAVHAAMAEFDVSRETVMKARRLTREWNEKQRQKLIAEWSSERQK